MFHRPTTRLLAIKFLGFFGGNQLNSQPEDAKRNNDDPVRKTSSPDPAGIRAAIELSERRIVGLSLEKGIPGITICVSKRGKILWNGAFGFCDVENQVACLPDAKMRIASISKPLFATTIVAPMIEQRKLDLKDSVHKYLSNADFPRQKYQDKEYDITIEQLLSHTGGIKSYDDVLSPKDPLKPIGSKDSLKVHQCDDQYNRKGFFQRQTFRGVVEALEPFKAGPLIGEPGNYKYTTYGYTLLSAVIEKVHQQSGEEISKNEQIEDYWMRVLRKDWELSETSLDQDEPILSNRARYYLRTGFNGTLINSPYTDNSVKWAGGGIISTAGDIVKFANLLINSYKGRESAKLKRDTVELLWKEIKQSYGLGFKLIPLDERTSGEKVAVTHMGGAVGASSALIIYPENEIVVAILCNLGEINLQPLALYVADRFVETVVQSAK